jgi:hypothetical protein
MFEAGISLATSPELREAGERPLPFCVALLTAVASGGRAISVGRSL